MYKKSLSDKMQCDENARQGSGVSVVDDAFPAKAHDDREIDGWMHSLHYRERLIDQKY
jgi:hypothetical protein